MGTEAARGGRVAPTCRSRGAGDSRGRILDPCAVEQSDWESEKVVWTEPFPSGPPDKDAIGRLVEEDHDEFETQIYEHYADPTYVRVETARRRYRGMIRRRFHRRRD